MATNDNGPGQPSGAFGRDGDDERWDRSRLEAALQALDADIDPLLDRCGSMAEFWSTFDATAVEIQRRAADHIWYAAAQLDRMLVRHGVMPRAGVFALPRERPVGFAPNIRSEDSPRRSLQG